MRLTPAGIFAVVAIVGLIAASIPVYALVLGLGWAWRLWIATVLYMVSALDILLPSRPAPFRPAGVSPKVRR